MRAILLTVLIFCQFICGAIAQDTITIDLPNLPEGAKPLEMVLIPAGSFTMGSPDSEQDRYSDEGPQHQVTISKSFYMGKYEVTQAQWEAVMGNNPSYYSGKPNNPVEQVPWNDCLEFIAKLNQMDLGTFHLPTEAEWEYACRAGTTERFYWGDDLYYSQINDYAWYSGNNSPSGTKEVGTKLPNPWGLFDMSGNVNEWCQDTYSGYSSTPEIDPVVTNSGNFRVLRGGSWCNDAWQCRSADRINVYPDYTYYYVGFRISRTAEIEPTPTPVVPTNTPMPTPTKTPTPMPTNTQVPPTPTPTIDIEIITVDIPNLPEGAKPLEMVLIPAGTFMMGSPSSEQDRNSDETQHQVTLTQDFYIGKYEVTQAQWEAVMGNNPSYFSGKPNNPVEQVLWNDCQKFITKLNQMSQGTFRLPTEAEWEYACRAGTTERFYWGDDPNYTQIEDYAWYTGNNSVNGSKEVATKLPNPWGLFDMIGNVYEWCQDTYSGYSSTPKIDPIITNSGNYRVLRGGSWYNMARYCRSAVRNDYENPVSTYSGSGFRLCRTYENEPKPTNTTTPTFTNTPVPPTPTPKLVIESITVNIPNLPEGAKPLEMVLIPAGTFMMGSPSSERNRGSDETQHQVTLTHDFYIGKYEITQAQWEAVMGNNPARNYGVGPNYPVYYVSWNDCQEFITKLNQMGLGTFRLPTEAEWEYACRAGTTERFYWGDDPNYTQIEDYAWYSGNNIVNGAKEVATKLSNPWGLFDMSGNVWEWCQDWYSDYPSTPITDPIVTNSGNYRVIRGGIWSNYAGDCRSAYRNSDSPIYTGNINGFRVSRTDGIEPTPIPTLSIEIPQDSFICDVDWIKYEDNVGRDIYYDFSSGQMNDNGQVILPSESIRSAPSTESDSVYSWLYNPQRDLRAGLIDGAYRVWTPQAEDDAVTLGTAYLFSTSSTPNGSKEWEMTARFSNFKNMNQQQYYYGFGVGCSSSQLGFFTSSFRISWFSGLMNGKAYHNALRLNATLDNNYESGVNKYYWELLEDDNNPDLLEGYNPDTVIIDTRCKVSNNGLTIEGFYRINSDSEDDFHLAFSRTLSPDQGTIYGSNYALPYIAQGSGLVDESQPKPTQTPTIEDWPTPTPTKTPEPLPTPTPEVTSNEPGVHITTKEILRRCSGKSVSFQVIVEGLNGFNDKVRLQLKEIPSDFDARIFPNSVVPPSRATLILTPKSDAGIFDNADGYSVEELVIQALTPKSKSVEETAYINILPRGAMILKDPVPREPYQIDLRSTSKGEETVGQTVKIKGQIYNNPAIRYITVSALRPGEFAPEIHPNVEVSKRGGYFDTEFEIRHSDQLVLDSNDAPWKIEAFYKSGTRDNPFNAVSEPLYLRVGASNPIAGKRSSRQLNMIASTDGDQSKIFCGQVIIVGGAQGKTISTNAIYNLTSSLYENLIFERRFDIESVQYLAPVPVDPSIGQRASNQSLAAAISNASMADYLLLYLVGDGDNGFFDLSSNESLTGDSLRSLLDERLQDATKHTLLIIDTHQAGVIKENFTTQANLEVIASTGSSEDSIAIFSVSDEGQPFSFSDLFFDGLMRGKTIRDSLAYSRKHLRRIQEPNIQQIPVPLENDLSEPFASLVLGTAYTPENEPMADNLPPRIEEVPDSMKILRGGTLHLKVKIRDEEEEDKDSSGEDVILSVRITEFGTSISYEIPATYLPDSDELDIHVENFPIEPFGENASNGQYTLSMLVQDNTDNSTAPAITSIDVIAPMQTYEFGESGLAESGWAEIPGGFSGAIPGRISMQGFNNPSIIPSSQDQKGMAIQVEPGQVAFVYATTPIQTNGSPILLRAMMRSTSQNAAIWCVGLKGDLSKTEQVDGSLTLTNAMTASAFLAQEKRNILLYNPIGEEPVTPVIQVQGNGDSATTVWIDRVEIYEIDPTKSYPSELFTMIETQPNSQTAQTSFQPDAVYEFDGASQWLEIPGGFEGANPGSIDLVDFGNNYNILPSSLDRKGLAVSMDKDELALIFSALPISVENEPVLMRMKVQASSSNVSNWLIGLKGNVATGENVDGSKGYNYLSQSYDYSNSEKTIILLYEPDSGTLITPGIQTTNKSGNGQAILYIDRMEIYKLKSGLYYPGSLFNGE